MYMRYESKIILEKQASKWKDSRLDPFFDMDLLMMYFSNGKYGDRYNADEVLYDCVYGCLNKMLPRHPVGVEFLKQDSFIEDLCLSQVHIPIYIDAMKEAGLEDLINIKKIMSMFEEPLQGTYSIKTFDEMLARDISRKFKGEIFFDVVSSLYTNASPKSMEQLKEYFAIDVKKGENTKQKFIITQHYDSEKQHDVFTLVSRPFDTDYITYKEKLPGYVDYFVEGPRHAGIACIFGYEKGIKEVLTACNNSVSPKFAVSPLLKKGSYGDKYYSAVSKLLPDQMTVLGGGIWDIEKDSFYGQSSDYGSCGTSDMAKLIQRMLESIN